MSNHAIILLAEDDPNDVFLIRRALEKAGLGHHLKHVENGQACIDYLAGTPPYDDRQKYPFPNLLLLDLKMPVLDGLEVLAWMKEQPQLTRLPVIILSASIIPSDKDTSLATGAAEFQVKPVDFAVLVQIMQAIDARWLANA